MYTWTVSVICTDSFFSSSIFYADFTTVTNSFMNMSVHLRQRWIKTFSSHGILVKSETIKFSKGILT